MRLGGQFYDKTQTPEGWVALAKSLGYRAATCPLGLDATDDQIRAYAAAAKEADLLIGEVGAWSNPLSSEAAERKAALDKCKGSLDLAERIGACCAVNITGSRGEQWAGPHPDNLSEETFEMIVETTREIIDAVNPKRTVYALETMPWVFPDSPQSYLRLIEAIDRPGLGVHLDPVNMINCPSRFYYNSDFLRECFQLLGPYIVSCHAKDIALGPNLTVHLAEVRPGLGGLDYATFLRELNQLNTDIPLILEHLPNEEEYRLAAEHIRKVAAQEGVPL